MDHRKVCLLIIDVQNDFISGTLAISNCPARHDGAEVIPVINKLLESVEFDLIVYSKDWHTDDHISFYENRLLRPVHPSSTIQDVANAEPLQEVVFSVEIDGHEMPISQILWPRHCVQDTPGAELHPDLKIVKGSEQVVKGTHSNIDSYSAFFDNSRLSRTNLLDILQRHQITDCLVCGIAYDVCVGSSAKHALELGFGTYLIDDASRGVSLEAIEATRRAVKEMGGSIIHSQDIPALSRSLRNSPLSDADRKFLASLKKL